MTVTVQEAIRLYLWPGTDDPQSLPDWETILELGEPPLATALAHSPDIQRDEMGLEGDEIVTDPDAIVDGGILAENVEYLSEKAKKTLYLKALGE